MISYIPEQHILLMNVLEYKSVPKSLSFHPIHFFSAVVNLETVLDLILVKHNSEMDDIDLGLVQHMY